VETYISSSVAGGSPPNSWGLFRLVFEHARRHKYRRSLVDMGKPEKMTKPPPSAWGQVASSVFWLILGFHLVLVPCPQREKGSS